MKRSERRAWDQLARQSGFSDVVIVQWLDSAPAWPTPQQVRYARERLDKRIGPAGGDKTARQRAYAAMRRLRKAIDAREHHWQTRRGDFLAGWCLDLEYERALLDAIEAQQAARLFVLPPGVAEPPDLVRERIGHLEQLVGAHDFSGDRLEKLANRPTEPSSIEDFELYVAAEFFRPRLPEVIRNHMNRDRSRPLRRMSTSAAESITYDDHGLTRLDSEFEPVSDEDDLLPSGLDQIEPKQARQIINDWIGSLDDRGIVKLAAAMRHDRFE